MPIEKHYHGHGGEVMQAMRATYNDPKEAKRVFYATEQKRKNEKKKGKKRSSKH